MRKLEVWKNTYLHTFQIIVSMLSFWTEKYRKHQNLPKSTLLTEMVPSLKRIFSLMATAVIAKGSEFTKIYPWIANFHKEKCF